MYSKIKPAHPVFPAVAGNSNAASAWFAGRHDPRSGNFRALLKRGRPKASRHRTGPHTWNKRPRRGQIV